MTVYQLIMWTPKQGFFLLSVLNFILNLNLCFLYTKNCYSYRDYGFLRGFYFVFPIYKNLRLFENNKFI